MTTTLTAEQRAALFAQGASVVVQDGVTYYAGGMALTEGAATRVNTTTAGPQGGMKIGNMSDGSGSIVTWNSGGDVYMQAFNGAGAPIGSETLVNTTTTGNDTAFAIVGVVGGRMLIWSHSDGSNFDFRAQLVDRNGVKVGSELILGSTDQNMRAVFKTVATGGFVMLEQHAPNGSSGLQLYAHRFDAAGSPAGSETLVSPGAVALGVGGFDLAPLPDGGFLALYTDQIGFPNFSKIQRVDAANNPVGAPTNVSLSGGIFPNHITSLSDGYVVTGGGTSLGSPLHAQVYTSAGVAVGAEITLDTNAAAIPTVTSIVDGGFLITWTVTNNGPAMVARYDAGGHKLGEFALFETGMGSTSAATAVAFDGSIKVAYTLQDYVTVDDVYLKTFTALDFHQLTGDADTIVGGDADTTVVGRAVDLGAADNLDGGAGFDTFELSASGTLNLAGAAAFTGFETLLGASGDDAILLTTAQFYGLATIDLRGGTDTLSFATSAAPVAVNMSGSSGKVVNVENLVGSAFGDTLIGSAQANVLTGGAGADQLTGGAGNDIFRDTAAGLNGDHITDFGVGDQIHITDANAFIFEWSLNASTLTYTGGSLTLSGLPSGYHLTAKAATQGVTLSLLRDANILNNGVSADFNGDGKDDLLWRSDSGAMSNWLGQANGGFVGNDANAFRTVGTDWHIIGAGDFNGDDKDDILWRSDIGQMSNWLGQANGGFVGNDANAFVNVPNDWQVAGVGDFNGDGKADLLWRSDTGHVSDWLGQANGGFVGNDANAFRTVGTDWHIIGVGDFNGDHRDDILWRSDQGQLSNWLGKADGGFDGNDANAFVAVSTDWHVVGVGDFNGDGKSDILWRSDAGQMSNWLGTASGGWAGNDANAFASVPTDWVIAGVGDYNGDGRSDILWRHSSGAMSNWLGQANGGFVGNDANAYRLVDPSWHIQVESFFGV